MAFRVDADGGDIEEPPPRDTDVANSDQPISPASIADSDQPIAAATSATDENPDGTKEPEEDQTSSKASCLSKSISLLTKLFTKISHFTWCITKFILWSLFGILATPILIVYVFITGDTSELQGNQYLNSSAPDKKDKKSKESSHIKKKKPTIKVKIHQLSMAMGIRLGCLVLVWLVLSLTIPNLKEVIVHGNLLWTWSLLATLILIGYPILVLVYMIIVQVLIPEGVSNKFNGSTIEYCMEGLSGSIMLIIYFSSILTTWFICIDTKNPDIHKFGTLTFVSFVVGAILNVVKSVVLLLWKTNLIYKKYERKILSAGCQLYFHLLIMDQMPMACVQLVSWWDWTTYEPQPFVDGSARTARLSQAGSKRKEGKDDNELVNRKKYLPIEEYLLEKGATLKHIDTVATYLTTNFELTLAEDNNILDIVPDLQRKFSSDERLDFGVTTTVRENSNMDGDDSKLLLEVLQIETNKEKPTYEDFEKWMVDGLNNCYAVGNRINGAIEVMRILNRILTSFIIVFVVMIWLLITGLATTKVVVGLASGFLGLTFIFGDTCKTFFQGVIFSFVTHPFDVADRCIVDSKELKVKKINILTTTFFGSKSKEIIMYPNSDLAAKHIVMLHGERESELEDLIEFVIPSKTKAPQIETLQRNIEGYIKEGVEAGRYKKTYRVTLKEIGSDIKLGVHFQHKLHDGDDKDKLENIEIRKDKQRSEFLLQLRKFLDGIDEKTPQGS